jgi:hypothetical protein
MPFISRFFAFPVLTMLGIVLLSSCDNTTSTPGPIITPDIWGQVSAIKQTRVAISGPDTAVTNSQMAMAYFYMDPHVTTAWADVGIVQINDISLIKDVTNSYYVDASPGGTHETLDLDNQVAWHVNGNGDIPLMAYNHVGGFPEYTGDTPFEIVKTSGVDLTFDSSNVSGADSVRIYIYDGTNSFEKSFSATAGAVSITPAELSVLSTVTDHSAYMGIFPYKGTIRIYSGKGFYFIKETRIIHSANIL